VAGGFEEGKFPSTEGDQKFSNWMKYFDKHPDEAILAGTIGAPGLLRLAVLRGATAVGGEAFSALPPAAQKGLGLFLGALAAKAGWNLSEHPVQSVLGLLQKYR
jgi:hypothetical protein